MVFRSPRKVLPKHMSAIAATICRIPNARIAIPAAIGASARTVENWLSGATQPTAMNLIALMREFPEVADDVLEMTGRTQSKLTHQQREKLLQILGEP